MDIHQQPRERRPKIAFYSHDTMGMGHLRRNMLIASSLSAGRLSAETLLIAGTREAGFFAEQAGLDCVTLPALRKSSSGHYTARHYDWSIEQATQLRGRVIASTLLAFKPDIFVVDKLPQGICNELLRTLRILKRRLSTRCILGLRDILDEPNIARVEWDKSNNDQIIANYFDEVWVYGDPKLYDCRSEYGFCASTNDRIRFVGYLDQSHRLSTVHAHRDSLSPLPTKPYALCVVGGGQDGFALAHQFVQATLPAGWQGIVITGPFMPSEDRAVLNALAAANPGMSIIEQLVESDHYIANAERVVAMGGYNTVMSILSFQKAAMVVPRVRPRMEQWIRANRLAQAGLISIAHPDQISTSQIATWLRESVVPSPNQCPLNLRGLHEIESIVAGWQPCLSQIA